MFRRRAGGSGPDSSQYPTRSPSEPLPQSPAPVAQSEPGHTVSDAEQVVRDAWTAELSTQHNRMDAALKVASEQCDDAYKRLALVQRGGDPKKIAAAHIVLEAALVNLRRSELVCERTHQAFLAEMDLLGRASAVHGMARELERGGLSAAASHPEAAPLPNRPAPAPSGFRQRARRRLGRLLGSAKANRPSR